jgi:hypothetical protein
MFLIYNKEHQRRQQITIQFRTEKMIFQKKLTKNKKLIIVHATIKLTAQIREIMT